MIENPIYNPTPNTGLKGQNPGLKAFQYQFTKAFRSAAYGIILVGRAVFIQLKDVIKQMFRPGY